jgi:hypothetical protein
MAKLVISDDARADDLAPLAIAVNLVVGLPVTMRSANFPGIRVENGKVLDKDYSGPVLEEAIGSGRVIRTIPDRGAFKGVPVSVAPIVIEGKVIAAMGIVDLAGTVDLPEVFGAYSEVVKQVSSKPSDRI